MPSFSRPNQLIEHLQLAHPELIGLVVSLPSDILLPSWRPFFPPPFPSPPALPKVMPAGTVILAPTAATTVRTRNRVIQPSPKQTLLRKRTMLHLDGDQSPELKPIIFDDLPDFPDSLTYEPQDFIIWRKPAVLEMDVSRPQSMRDPSLSEISPPVSILYETFARRVDQLEKDQLLLS